MHGFNMSKIIAEIGCNHKGDLEIAKKHIENAAEFCGVDVVKFQKRNNVTLLSEKVYNSPHPVPENSYGSTYGEHREFLEFSIEQHQELKDYAESLNVTYSTSVWDLVSAKEVAEINPTLIKIPSATNLNFELQGWLCDFYEGQIHVSTGMSTAEEVEKIVTFYEDKGRSKDVVLYVCTSGYPVAYDELCLLEINKFKKLYGSRVGNIAFSGHHLGIAADIAALTLGVDWIERHFTLDRTWKGTDHAASLEPDGMRKLVRDIANVKSALSYKETDILPIESEQRKKLKWLG